LLGTPYRVENDTSDAGSVVVFSAVFCMLTTLGELGREANRGAVIRDSSARSEFRGAVDLGAVLKEEAEDVDNGEVLWS
jgi:hypothetical protein